MLLHRALREIGPALCPAAQSDAGQRLLVGVAFLWTLCFHGVNGAKRLGLHAIAGAAFADKPI